MTTSSGPRADHPTRTITARTPEDLLALVPVVLGFEPEDSIVMLAVRARTPFHARLDLPHGDDLPDAVAALLGPARQHGVGRVVLILYTGRETTARRFRRLVRPAFRGEGIEIVDLMRVHDGRWFSLSGHPGVPEHGVPFDVATHPFRVEAVAAGEVLASSRGEIAARLRPDPPGVEAVSAALEDLFGASARACGQVGGPLAGDPPDMSGTELRETLRRHAEAGDRIDDLTAARILVAVSRADPGGRAWVGLTAQQASRHVRLWGDLLRRAPTPLDGPAAAVLAALAWVAGRGALAWCAVDRSRERCVDHPLTDLVALLLEHAVPPPGRWSPQALAAAHEVGSVASRAELVELFHELSR
ncbi:DUF4192 domain-containing protein [Nocardioides insulae]|uniref:DUF4192 domain-containing protein n=1 Tax=Nocardioides insulae TaxID=394734 RepID=UPI000422AE2B|nr:DUF4192 domain-containing protein [Nocardioides insulae]